MAWSRSAGPVAGCWPRCDHATTTLSPQVSVTVAGMSMEEWHTGSDLPLARAHVGWLAAIDSDGSENGSADLGGTAIGWRAACRCGWRGLAFHAADGRVSLSARGRSEAVAEWQTHLARELPGLAVHDLYRLRTEIDRRLREALIAARRSGLAWDAIAFIVGMTPVQARRMWSALDHPAAPTAVPAQRRALSIAPPTVH